MRHVKILFRGCEQKEQGLDTDQYMISTVFFDLDVEGRNLESLQASIKQPVGGNYTTDPLEVYLPDGYKGPLNYEFFRLKVESYYRELVGANAKFLQLPSSQDLLKDNMFLHPKAEEFDFEDVDFSW